MCGFHFDISKPLLTNAMSGLTVCVTCVWAGVDNAWEQGKLEARKMLENAAESHTSGARFVSLPFAQDEPFELHETILLDELYTFA